MVVFFVTGNKNKVAECAQILSTPLAIKDIDLPEIQSLDVRAVAEQKAKDAYAIVRAPLIVEDVGIHFPAWNNFPGALAKWFLQSFSLEKICSMLALESNKNIHVQLYLCYYDGEHMEVFSGTCNGIVPPIPRGENGFGFDAIIELPDGRTIAELSREEKCAVSHRAMALRKLQAYLEKQSALEK